jgi:hypothetical protein
MLLSFDGLSPFVCKNKIDSSFREIINLINERPLIETKTEPLEGKTETTADSERSADRSYLQNDHEERFGQDISFGPNNRTGTDPVNY